MCPAGRLCVSPGVSDWSDWPGRFTAASLSTIAAVPLIRTASGAASHAPPDTPPSTRGRDPGPGDLGHLFPPSLLQAQQEGPNHKAHDHVMMPSSPGAGLLPVQSHVALFGLELRFNAPSRTTHTGQGLQRGVLGSVGQVVAGLAAVQVPPVYGPEYFVGLPPAGWPHPLRTEPVAAGTLTPLGYCCLPPGLLRQRQTALIDGATLLLSQFRLEGTPVARILRDAPCGFQWPYRHVRPHVHYLPHPRCRQVFPQCR